MTSSVFISVDMEGIAGITTVRQTSRGTDDYAWGRRREFPGEYLDQTVEEALRSGDPTVRKLLIDGRWAK